MTSSMTSSYSADDLREQSQESAGSLYIQTQERSDVVEEAIQSQATVHQQMLFGDSDSKTIGSSRLGIQSQESRCSGELHPDARFQSQYSKISAEYEFSRSDLSATKQLTIYESWMSTAELNSNGENDKKPAKKRTQVLFPVGTLQNTFEREEFCVQRDYFKQSLYTSRSAIEDRLLVGENQSAVAEVNRTVHQQRENEKKDEAIDRH
ncbi:hypothetical protein F511_34878 [Dorcoceras hygrometricum]|uniref:Uncharacterized protein n=1 Tax=Dorcoceras hygrometricum TaxID=472368 RepID=A0A2Z7CB14_9LAMI|nr:hypothetical protein F511_34878 [Dorcoceras hygrometricum]